MTKHTEATAAAEAIKRNKVKSKFLTEKTWKAVHDSVKGWHVALVDTYQPLPAGTPERIAASRKPIIDNPGKPVHMT